MNRQRELMVLDIGMFDQQHIGIIFNQQRTMFLRPGSVCKPAVTNTTPCSHNPTHMICNLQNVYWQYHCSQDTVLFKSCLTDLFFPAFVLLVDNNPRLLLLCMLDICSNVLVTWCATLFPEIAWYQFGCFIHTLFLALLFPLTMFFSFVFLYSPIVGKFS